eukprot:2397809-Rhodomonas_salina.4
MNVTEATGYTPLHMAARWGRARAVQRLLELGADAEATDKVGVSLSVSVGCLLYTSTLPTICSV